MDQTTTKLDIGHDTVVMDSKFMRKQWVGLTAKISFKI